MQATIDVIHAQVNKDDDQAKKIKAQVPKEDDDFRTIDLDDEILSLDEAPDDKVVRRNTCVLCSWIECLQNGAVNT